ncbi:MAG: enoyl-CoA hydratase/isomerase family protein [Proteobacteria bacterium]|nr:enoyl-CoA hydratase/isomerase family protein [Pseudomonadota bacterium]
MSNNHLIGQKKDGIYTIILNRPGKRNAIPFEMLVDLSEMVEGLVVDPEIRAIIIKGEGKVFSAGVDFISLAGLVDRFLADSAAGGAPIRADIHKYQHYLNRLESIEIPIICAMHGVAFGMSLELALACDIRLMSDDCLWGMMELQFGTIPDLGGTARLSKLLGRSRAFEILSTGRRYTAQQALDWGLVNYLYPEDQLIQEAENLARDISKMAPIAVGAVKKVINRGDGVDLMTHLDMEANLQSVLLRSEDFQEGVKAMMEKRDPQWKRR